MLIGPPIPEIRLLKKMTLKIKGQGHGWGHSSKSQCGSNILSIHISFVPCQSDLPFLRYSSFKIWLWKSKVKVIAQGHKVGIAPYRLISFLFHIWSALPFLSYDFLKIWPWKSRVKVMGEVTVQRHSVGLTSCRLTSLSFHANRPSHSLDTAVSKFDLENPRSRS